VAEESIKLQAIRSILPFADYNNKNRLNKIRDFCCLFFLVLITIVLIIIFTDTRPAGPIEDDMIKEFAKNISMYG